MALKNSNWAVWVRISFTYVKEKSHGSTSCLIPEWFLLSSSQWYYNFVLACFFPGFQIYLINWSQGVFLNLKQLESILFKWREQIFYIFNYFSIFIRLNFLEGNMISGYFQPLGLKKKKKWPDFYFPYYLQFLTIYFSVFLLFFHPCFSGLW